MQDCPLSRLSQIWDFTKMNWGSNNCKIVSLKAESQIWDLTYESDSENCRKVSLNAESQIWDVRNTKQEF